MLFIGICSILFALCLLHRRHILYILAALWFKLRSYQIPRRCMLFVRKIPGVNRIFNRRSPDGSLNSIVGMDDMQEGLLLRETDT